MRPLAFVRNPYGDGTYLVGYAVNGEQVLGLRTLKLGRILNVRPTHTPFELHLRQPVGRGLESGVGGVASS
ncbi:MAG UNVERIFIED_CONTAM: hypothetical protein LVT10_17570 [Anaerolineae bacterium]